MITLMPKETYRNKVKKLSLVVPVFNEQDNLHEFYKRTSKVCANEPYELQIIFVDDGSSDNSRLLLRELCEQDSRVEAYFLSRNYGHQLALTCGLDHAQGDAVITMDGDLQHPPELIPELLRLWEADNEIVQTKRMATEDAGYAKNITSSCYYRLINALSNVEITPGGSDFRLMDRVAVEALNQYREKARFIRGLVKTLGFREATLEFVAPPRFAGTSKFSLKKMLHFAFDGITSFSNLPLRWAFYVGIFFGFASLFLLLHILYVTYITGDIVPGWPTTMCCMLFLGGIQLIGIGILGEYIGRIFTEVKNRPLYIVSRHIKNAK